MMKSYPEYKDSGIEWIGKIPIHWNIMKLKFSDSIIMGQSPDSEDYNTMKIGLPFLQGTADFTDIHPKPRIYCASAKKTSIKNDILLSVRAPIGEVNISDQTFGIGRGLCAIRANKSFQKYLYYCMLSLNQELNSIGTGSTYKAVSIEDIENLYIVQPEIIEQKAIASFISHKNQKIDELIAGKEKLIELLREQRAAVINHAVTKGLDPHAKMKDSGIPWLGAIPEHWELKKLKFISNKISKGTTPSTIGKDVMLEGEVRFLKAENIVKNQILNTPEFFIDNETDAILYRSQLKENDILIVIAGATIGKVAITHNSVLPANTNQAISFLRLNQEADSKYVWFWLQSYYIKQMISLEAVQSAQPNLAMEDLGNFQILFQNRNEQEIIATFLDRETEK